MASSCNYHLEYLYLRHISFTSFLFGFPQLSLLLLVLNFVEQDQKFHVNSLKDVKYTYPLASLFLKTCGHTHLKPVMILII